MFVITWMPLGVVGILMVYLVFFPIGIISSPSFLGGMYPRIYSIIGTCIFPLAFVSSSTMVDGPASPSTTPPLIELRVILVILFGVIG